MNITKIMAKQDLELYIFKKRRRPLGEDRSKKNANLTIKHSKKYKRTNWAINLVQEHLEDEPGYDVLLYFESNPVGKEQ